MVPWALRPYPTEMSMTSRSSPWTISRLFTKNGSAGWDSKNGSVPASSAGVAAVEDRPPLGGGEGRDAERLARMLLGMAQHGPRHDVGLDGVDARAAGVEDPFGHVVERSPMPASSV